jgi:hypothetical protein
VAFHVISIGLTSAVLALGTLTGVRVHNASSEGAAIILGMNRLRAGYVKMDPGIAEYLVTSRSVWTPSPASPRQQQATAPTHGTRSDMLISAGRAPPPPSRTHVDAREVRQPV